MVFHKPQRIPRKSFVVLTSLCFLLLWSSVAFALVYQESVCWGPQGEPSRLCRGTRAYTLVYQNQIPGTNCHVASDYVYRGEISGRINMVELGWRGGYYCCWYGNYHDALFNHTFNHFWAIAIQWDPKNPTLPGTGYWCMDIAQASPYSNNEYCMQHIRQEPDGTQLYNLYINGGFVAGLDVQFVDGWSMMGVERNSTNITNAGTFTSCRKLVAGQNWTAWDYNSIYEYSSSDPYYEFYKVSNPPSGPTVECRHI
jgi:hypothetical protein